MVHEGEKFKCNECGFKTSRLRNMSRHNKLVHTADQCTKDFKLDSVYINHLKKAHNPQKYEVEFLKDLKHLIVIRVNIQV